MSVVTDTENYIEPAPMTLEQLADAADGCWYGVPVAGSEYGTVWAFTHDRRRAAAAVSAWAREILGQTVHESVDYVRAFLSADATTERWGLVVDTCGHVERDEDCEDGIPPCGDEWGWVIRRDVEATPGALPYLELRS